MFHPSTVTTRLVRSVSSSRWDSDFSGCMVGTVCQILWRFSAKVEGITWLLHIKDSDRWYGLDLPVWPRNKTSDQMKNDTETQTSVGQNHAEVLSNTSKKLSIRNPFNTKTVNQLLRQCMHSKSQNLLPIAGISHHDHAPAFTAVCLSIRCTLLILPFVTFACS